MKKLFIVTMILLFIPSQAQALDKYSTGRDWVRASEEEKIDLIKKFQRRRSRRKVETQRIIDCLDNFYRRADFRILRERLVVSVEMCSHMIEKGLLRR